MRKIPNLLSGLPFNELVEEHTRYHPYAGKPARNFGPVAQQDRATDS